MKKPTNKQIYELSLSQEVVRLQCKFSIYKCIVNITMSATSDEKLDWDVMKHALNICVQRHDCTRLRLFKKGGTLMQYFEDEVTYDDIPYLEFATAEEQAEYIRRETSHPIKYLKGEVFKPFFVRTYDGKDMILVKVCHYIFDNYGLNIFFKDLFDVYHCLKDGTELPAEPTKFETILQKDIAYRHNEVSFEKNEAFYADYFAKREGPYYAGIHGLTNKIAVKQYPTKGMKFFFIKNDTKGYMYPIDSALGADMMEYCREHGVSPNNLMFYACSLVQSKLNNDTKHMLQLQLCNCRGTMAEKTCSGTKVQSLGCYTTVEQDKSIQDNLMAFNDEQKMLMRHIGFPDTTFQMMSHKAWNTSPIKTYYAITFSFIPVMQPKGVQYQIYSNGKFVLPSYVAAMYNVDTHEIQMIYDCQKKIITDENVEYFHKNLLHIIRAMISQPDLKVSEVKLLEK